jgi:multicomponent Na+:H+ antiporter subunit D
MNLIPLFVAVPLGAAFVLALLGKLKEVVSDLLAGLSTLSLAVLSFIFIGN